MLIDTQPEPTVMVIFGASGDLTWRKLVPALYNLFLVCDSSLSRPGSFPTLSDVRGRGRQAGVMSDRYAMRPSNPNV